MSEATEACERWFLDRGTPHLIAGYRATTDVFTRALPTLVLVFLVSVSAAGNVDWSWYQNAAAIAGGFVVLAALWGVSNRLRGRRLLQRPDDVGTVELAVYVLGPAVLQVVFGAQLRAAVGTALLMLVSLAPIYLVTSYGLLPMTRFALAETFLEVRAVAGLVARALPLLLLVNAFLFINAEMWQVADGLTGLSLAAAVLLFLVVGVLFLVIRLPAEIDRVAAEQTDPARTAGTPVAGLAVEPDASPLGSGERRNLLLVLLVSQAIQVLVVALLIGVFFVAFGLVAVSPETIGSWIGTAGDVLADFEVLGTQVVLTAELLTVATFLSAFSALYFTVQVVTDGTYREEFFDELLDELRTTLAVRGAYRSLVMAAA